MSRCYIQNISVWKDIFGQCQPSTSFHVACLCLSRWKDWLHHTSAWFRQHRRHINLELRGYWEQASGTTPPALPPSLPPSPSFQPLSAICPPAFMVSRHTLPTVPSFLACSQSGASLHRTHRRRQSSSMPGHNTRGGRDLRCCGPFV